MSGPGEEWWLEDLVDGDVAHPCLPAHVVGQVALVGPGVSHHSLRDLKTNQLTVCQKLAKKGVKHC